MTTIRRVSGVFLGLFGVLIVIAACVPFGVCWLLFHAGTQALAIAKEWTR